MYDINKNIKRLNRALMEKAKKISSASLHEAFGKRGALNRTIMPIFGGTVVCGSALTVSCCAGDNLGLHVAIAIAEAGDVIVAATNGSPDFGYWGQIMTVAANEKKIAGLVIDGCVRDYVQIRDLHFPIFARGLCIKGTKKEAFRSINHPIRLGNVLINPGDLVLGDADGVVVISYDRVADVIEKAIERDKKEEIIIENLKKGKNTLELLGLNNKIAEHNISL